jgi:hypothetical protein
MRMVIKIYTMNKVFSNNEKGQEQRRFGMEGGEEEREWVLGW